MSSNVDLKSVNVRQWRFEQITELFVCAWKPRVSSLTKSVWTWKSYLHPDSLLLSTRRWSNPWGDYRNTLWSRRQRYREAWCQILWWTKVQRRKWLLISIVCRLEQWVAIGMILPHFLDAFAGDARRSGLVLSQSGDWSVLETYWIRPIGHKLYRRSIRLHHNLTSGHISGRYNRMR